MQLYLVILAIRYKNYSLKYFIIHNMSWLHSLLQIHHLVNFTSCIRQHCLFWKPFSWPPKTFVTKWLVFHCYWWQRTIFHLLQVTIPKNFIILLLTSWTLYLRMSLFFVSSLVKQTSVFFYPSEYSFRNSNLILVCLDAVRN